MSRLQELVSSGASTAEIVEFVLQSVPEGPGQSRQRSSAEIGERMLEQDMSPPDEYSPLDEVQELFVSGALTLEQYTEIFNAVDAKTSG